MEFTALRNCLSKLKPFEIHVILERWKCFKKVDVQYLETLMNGEVKRTKTSLVNEIIEYCEEKDAITMEDVGEVDLMCVQLHSAKKQWSAYCLSKKQGARTPNVTRSPTKFKSALKKYIGLYFKKDVSVSVLLYKGLLWCRLYFPVKGKSGYLPRQNLYFIYYPESTILLFNGMKVSYSRFLSQCLVVCLGYQEITELCLTGHHYESLAELAMNKHMEGGFARYQNICWGEGPLNEVTSRKRKAPVVIENEHITDLHHADKRRRLDDLEKHFGQNVQPTLEKVQFKVELPYRSKEVASELRGSDDLFHSRIRFRGASVLEGLRNLATAGLAVMPLPKHLTTVSTRARNCFILARPTGHNSTAAPSVAARNTPAHSKRPVTASRAQQENINRSLRQMSKPLEETPVPRNSVAAKKSTDKGQSEGKRSSRLRDRTNRENLPPRHRVRRVSPL